MRRMPVQMEFKGGRLSGIRKSEGINIVEAHAKDSILNHGEQRSWNPDCVIVDFATKVHQGPPTDKINSRRVALRTWEQYAVHLMEAFLLETCTRGGKVAEVILCFDKRAQEPEVKAFSHATREDETFSIGETSVGGDNEGAQTYRSGSGNEKRKKYSWTAPVPFFGPKDGPPHSTDWETFLGVRQNLDGVFSVFCRTLSAQLTDITARYRAGRSNDISPL